MPGYAFPDPKSRNYIPSSNRTLVLTEYGTIKGNNNFKEKTINEFIKEIEKNINNWDYKLDEDTYKHTIKKNTKVIDNDDDNYIIIINDIKYELKLDADNINYSYLKSKLNSFKKKTADNQNIENIINDFEINNNVLKHNNNRDIKIYLGFLSHLKKKYFRKFILNLIVSIIIKGSLLVTGLITTILLFPNPVFIPMIIACIGLYFISNAIMNEVNDSYSKKFI